MLQSLCLSPHLSCLHCQLIKALLEEISIMVDMHVKLLSGWQI